MHHRPCVVFVGLLLAGSALLAGRVTAVCADDSMASAHQSPHTGASAPARPLGSEQTRRWIAESAAAGWPSWPEQPPSELTSETNQKREEIGGLRWASLPLLLAMSILSIAPAILLMTTSFVRISVVLSMLRHAIGAQQAPSNQVVMALSLFLSALIMTPVWREVHARAIAPYLAEGSTMSLQQAWTEGVQPVRRFMSRQIEAAGNSEEVWLFYRYLPESATQQPPSSYDEVPLQALAPAFLVSELKIAFLIGFQIFLPFVILDLVVASVTTSIGMVMLPPAMISLPFKLMLFVMVDGWRLVVSMLLSSFVV